MTSFADVIAIENYLQQKSTTSASAHVLQKSPIVLTCRESPITIFIVMNKTFNHIPPSQNIQELSTVNEDNARFYQTPNNRKYPSVTTVCGFEKAHFFAQWRKDNPQEARRTSQRGNILHEALERYVNNEPVGELEKNEAMLFANMKRNVDRIDNVRAQEVALWSDTLASCWTSRLCCRV